MFRAVLGHIKGGSDLHQWISSFRVTLNIVYSENIQNLDHLAQDLATNVSSVSPGILSNAPGLKLTIGFKCLDGAHVETY